MNTNAGHEPITASFLRSLLTPLKAGESASVIGKHQLAAMFSRNHNAGRVIVQMGNSTYDVTPSKHEPAMLSLTPIVAGMFGASLTWGHMAFSNALETNEIKFL